MMLGFGISAYNHLSRQRPTTVNLRTSRDSRSHVPVGGFQPHDRSDRPAVIFYGRGQNSPGG